MEDAFKPLLSKGKETLKQQKNASLAAEKEKRKDIDEEIDKEIRSNFIFKVYVLLLCQLLIAVIMITFSLYSESFKYVLLHVRAVYIMFFIIAALTFIGPNFFPKILKLHPYNYIYLFTFTISYDYIICEQTCKYTPITVMMALVLTFITVATLTVYAKHAKTDFSILGGTFFVSMNLFVIGNMITYIIGAEYSSYVVICCCCIVFSTYIIYDTQLIIGEGGERFGEDDYILATMCLYIDIINLFLQILKLISKAMDDEKNKDSKADKMAEEFFGNKKGGKKEEDDDEEKGKGKGKGGKGKDDKKGKGGKGKDDKKGKGGKGKDDKKGKGGKGKDDKKGKGGKGGKGKDDKKGGDEKKEKKEDDESVEQKFNKQLEDLTNNLFGI